MIIDTKLYRWELDLSKFRVRFVEILNMPDYPEPTAQLFDEDGLPKCFLANPQDSDGWVACTWIKPPVVGEALELLYANGTKLDSSTVQAIS